MVKNKMRKLIDKILRKIPFSITSTGVILIILIVIYGVVGSYLIMHLDIANSFYYTIIAIATVGYGDITPHTIIQKFFSTTLAIGGIDIVAYIFTVVLTNFSIE